MAHHGASKNTRLTRLMKKRNAVAPSSSLNIAHHRQTPDVSESNQGAGQDDTGQGDMDEVYPVPPRISATVGNSDEDVPKVLATVVNVVNSDIPHSTDLTVPGLTMPSGNPIIEASLTATATAIPAYSSLTADTPSLTANSLTSATSSNTSSGTASRPLISSTPPAQTSSAAASASNSSGSSAASASNSNSSRIFRPSSKPTTPVPLSITSFNSTSSSDSSSSTTSSFTGTATTTTDSDFTSTRWIDGFGGGGRGGSKTGGIGPTSTGTDASPPPTGGPTVPPTTSKIVGGVVGSVAGAVMLVILALFLLKRRTAMRTPHEALPSSETTAAAAAAGGSGGAGAGAGAARGMHPEMASRFSRDSMLMTSFFTPAFMRRWRDSSHTDSTLVSSGSERGFQKISGRKIPSVLTSGGDGYGGGYETVSPAGSEPSMTPMIPGSPVNPRSPSMPPPPSIPHGMPLDVSYTQETAEFDDGDTIMHASPARPVVPDIVTVAARGVPVNLSRSNTYSPGAAGAAAAGALSPPIIQQPFQRPDLRTSHSFDGSRGSRFTEDC